MVLGSSARTSPSGRPAANSPSLEVIPAVLVKTENELRESINKVRSHVKTIHIDVMDDKFVPNKTIGIQEINSYLADPSSRVGVIYEFHWMVENPAKWILELKTPNKLGSDIQLVHIETIKSRDDWQAVKRAVSLKGDELGLVINPETPLDSLLKDNYANDCSRILVMAVHPGFSGQKYITEVEGKISELRKRYSQLDIEIDGGVDVQTAISASKAGANKLAAASSIFKSESIPDAIKKLNQAGKKGKSQS